MNNGFNNFGGQYYGGMIYQPQQAPKLNMTQGVTPEQINAMRKTGGFSLDIPQEEMWRAFCTHRRANEFTVTQDEEGNYTCSLCGTKFKPFEGSLDEAKKICEDFVDLLETTKMQSITLPASVIQDMFQIEPLAKRVPELFRQSKNDYKRAMGINDSYMYAGENNAFASYQNMINPMSGGYVDPAMMNQGYMQQPMMNQGYQQPMMQQPMMNQGYQQPMMGQPMMQGYGAENNPFNSNPAPVVQTQQPQQAQQNEPVKVTKQLTD